jgi:hypothetical protein
LCPGTIRDLPDVGLDTGGPGSPQQGCDNEPTRTRLGAVRAGAPGRRISCRHQSHCGCIEPGEAAQIQKRQTTITLAYQAGCLYLLSKQERSEGKD